MRYMLAYMLPEAARGYHRELSDRLAERFRLKPVSARIDPHLTLKASFDTDTVYAVRQAIQGFAKKEKPKPLTLCGIDYFPKRVIYMDVTAPKQTHMMLRRMQDQLKDIPWLPFGPNELPLRLHATLCYAQNAEQTKEIRAYLENETRHTFELELDSIALLKKYDRWEIVEYYPLSG